MSHADLIARLEKLDGPDREADWPVAKCCTGEDKYCVCPDMERALRGWKRGEALPAMTDEQRQTCLCEIGRVEGYSVADHADDSDADLSGAVLGAWVDYCRDKGLM